jgi:hypothetical protein
VQVTEVARTGPEALLVRFRLVNPDPAAPVAPGDAFAQSPDEGSSLSGVYLIDETGRKKLFVLRDDQDHPLCSVGLGAIAPGGRIDAWARYPAPGPGALRVTVQVPKLAPFRGLPVTAGTSPAPVGQGFAGTAAEGPR